MKLLLVKLFVLIFIRTNVHGRNDNIFPEQRYMNTSIDPCDDFFEYCCGNFKNIYPLNNYTQTVDHFTLLEEEINEITHNILSQPDAKDDPKALKKSKSAFKACADTKYLDKLINPEMTIVEAEGGFPLVEVRSKRMRVKYGFRNVGTAISKYGIPMLFDVSAYTDLEDSTKNLLFILPLTPTSLTPKDVSSINPHQGHSYHQFIEKAFQQVAESADDIKPKRNVETPQLKPFDIFLRNMALKLRNATESILSDEQVFDNLDEVVAFTRGVFKAGMDGNVTVEDFKSTTLTLNELNKWTNEQFNNTVDLDWIEFLQNLFANSGKKITGDTEVMTYTSMAQFMYDIVNLMKQTEDHVVKSYVLMRLFTHFSPDGDSHSRGYIDDYFRSMNYTILPRWKYCTRKIIDAVGTAGLSFAVAYEYQLRHYNVNNLRKIVDLIEALRWAFKNIIEGVTWMDSESKDKALVKFKNMITILAHPDISANRKALDKFYENLRICKWDNYGNSFRIQAFKNAYQISQIAKRDRAFWDKSPFEVNAYYNRPNNKMTLPISMLNPVFFGNANRILDYGRIGAIIGHEMTHGFDKDGMMYGPEGTLSKWWTENTTAAFTNRTKCFIDEYNGFYVPEINANVNGTNTLNENIADNGGLREAYNAFKRLLKKYKDIDENPHFTPEQLFFVGFGTLWCNNPSRSFLESMKFDAHSPSKYRVNGVVSNMEEFSEAFRCPVGSKMNPENKCVLW